MRVRALIAAALIVASCGGALPAASPTPPGRPLSIAELKYRVMDAGGRIEFCDPDFYPIARADERDLAQQHIAEIQADADTYAAITQHVGTDVVAVYRDWKALRALAFGALTFGSPITNQAYPFTYRSTGGPTATSSKTSGVQIDGQVDTFGAVDVTKRTAVGPLNCPICLARGTRIATPSGDAAVEDLRVGDIVWTTDASGGRVAAPLTAIGSTPVPATHEVVRLVLDDGRVVLASPGHPTTDGRRAGELRAGDTLDGGRIVSADREPYAGEATFDILPAGMTGAYWANGILLGSTLR